MLCIVPFKSNPIRACVFYFKKIIYFFILTVERERGRQADRQTGRLQTDKHRHRLRDRETETERQRQRETHTPSIAFGHIPPNSARFSYATEGALFIAAQLSSDPVSALRKIWVLIRLWKQPSAQAPT